jgi:F-type H+-transporting ATPase subunit alpha
MQDYMKQNHADLVARIEAEKALSKDDEKLLKDALAEFKKSSAY